MPESERPVWTQSFSTLECSVPGLLLFLQLVTVLSMILLFPSSFFADDVNAAGSSGRDASDATSAIDREKAFEIPLKTVKSHIFSRKAEINVIAREGSLFAINAEIQVGSL